MGLGSKPCTSQLKRSSMNTPNSGSSRMPKSSTTHGLPSVRCLRASTQITSPSSRLTCADVASCGHTTSLHVHIFRRNRCGSFSHEPRAAAIFSSRSSRSRTVHASKLRTFRRASRCALRCAPPPAANAYERRRCPLPTPIRLPSAPAATRAALPRSSTASTTVALHMLRSERSSSPFRGVCALVAPSPPGGRRRIIVALVSSDQRCVVVVADGRAASPPSVTVDIQTCSTTRIRNSRHDGGSARHGAYPC